jgi:hypothetical protein
MALDPLVMLTAVSIVSLEFKERPTIFYCGVESCGIQEGFNIILTSFNISLINKFNYMEEF